MSQNSFNWRSCIALVLATSTLILLISGMVIFETPEGRIIYGSDWRLLAFGKERWRAIHALPSDLHRRQCRRAQVIPAGVGFQQDYREAVVQGRGGHAAFPHAKPRRLK